MTASTSRRHEDRGRAMRLAPFSVFTLSVQAFLCSSFCAGCFCAWLSVLMWPGGQMQEAAVGTFLALMGKWACRGQRGQQRGKAGQKWAFPVPCGVMRLADGGR